MLLSAVQLIDEQRISLPDYAAAFPQVVTGVDGQIVSRYGIGQPLLAAACYWFGRYVIGWYVFPGSDDFQVGKSIALLLPAIATACTAGILAQWASTLYNSAHRGVLVALLYGIGTLAFPYARFFFSEPLFTACLVLAAYAIFTHRPLTAGLAAGYAVATRIGGIVLIPALLIYAWLKGYPRQKLTRLLVGLLPGIGLVLLHNWLRFHSLVEQGYAADKGFTGDVIVGLYGLLFSPGKAVFLYVPLLLVIPAALSRFARRFPAETLLIGMLTSITLIQSALWWMWWAGWGWGPRFLVPLMPLLTLTMGSLLDHRSWRILIIGLLLPLSLAVNLAGILVDFNDYLSEITHGSLAREAIYLFDPMASPILAHIQRLDLTAIPIVSFDLSHPRVGFPPEVAPLLSLGIVALIIVALVNLFLTLYPTRVTWRKAL
jgi:hypothetical protein